MDFETIIIHCNVLFKHFLFAKLKLNIIQVKPLISIEFNNNKKITHTPGWQMLYLNLHLDNKNSQNPFPGIRLIIVQNIAVIGCMVFECIEYRHTDRQTQSNFYSYRFTFFL